MLYIRSIIFLGGSSFNELIKLVTYIPLHVLLMIPLAGSRWTCLLNMVVAISLWVSRFDGVDENLYSILLSPNNNIGVIVDLCILFDGQSNSNQDQTFDLSYSIPFYVVPNQFAMALHSFKRYLMKA